MLRLYSFTRVSMVLSDSASLEYQWCLLSLFYRSINDAYWLWFTRVSMVLSDSVSQEYQWCLLALFQKGINGAFWLCFTGAPMVLTDSVSLECQWCFLTVSLECQWCSLTLLLHRSISGDYWLLTLFHWSINGAYWLCSTGVSMVLTNSVSQVLKRMKYWNNCDCFLYSECHSMETNVHKTFNTFYLILLLILTWVTKTCRFFTKIRCSFLHSIKFNQVFC